MSDKIRFPKPEKDTQYNVNNNREFDSHYDLRKVDECLNKIITRLEKKTKIGCIEGCHASAFNCKVLKELLEMLKHE